ncbi:hypothetical protein Barb4_04094 [Bacteroidales bacterium Barb4]|nr:hypothetical protein Barb4_04094 [Bacteroidales bacterium Barb4]
MRPNGRAIYQNESIESVAGRKEYATFIYYPFIQMITVSGDGFHAYRISIPIACATHSLCATVFDIGQVYHIAVFLKIRLNGHVPCQGEGIGIGRGKVAAICVSPFLKMITHGRSGFRAYRVLIRIVVFAAHCRCATADFAESFQNYMKGVFRKMRPNGRVPCQDESKGIGGRKGVALCICPFY